MPTDTGQSNMSKLLPISPDVCRSQPMHPFSHRWTWFAKALCLVLMLIGMKTAFASDLACGGVSMTSPFPSNRVVDSGTQVGRVFYRGFLVVTLSNCRNSSANTLPLNFTVEIPVGNVAAPLPVPAASGISVESTTPTFVVSPSGLCTRSSGVTGGASTSITFRHPKNANCTYTITFPITLSMTSSSNIAATGISALSNLNPWWVSYTSSDGLTGTINSSFDLISTACTLTTPNVTVTLPRVSVSALSGGFGTTAARTPFILALGGCTDLGTTYLARASWTFVPGAADPSSIANSASTPASNVYVQLLDSGFTPIGNGETSIIAFVSAAGAYQSQHYAQYFAGPGVVGAGMVKGVATLNLMYD